MSRPLHLPVLAVAVATLSACAGEPTSVDITLEPTSGVRFIHAVPDTGTLDFRFVDLPENSSHYAIPFRNNIVTTGSVPASTQVQFKNARAGNRRLRIFLNSTNQAIASTVLKDTTVDLTAGTNYTFLLWGYAHPTGPNRPAGAPAMRLTVIPETITDPGSNVALRVINTSTQAIDVRHYKYSAAVPATPPAAAFTNVGALAISSFITAAPDTFRFNVRNAGTATAFVTPDGIALRGAPAVTTAPGPFDAVPGTAIAGSAVTGIVFPRSVAGTAAPQVTGFAAPAISYVWDRRPPRPGGV